jgi:hypothetical protein
MMGALTFAILAADEVEIMYQVTSSLKEDLLKSLSAEEGSSTVPHRAMLYVAVNELAKVESQLLGERLVMPRRTTSHRSVEVGYADPHGNLIFFAEHQAQNVEKQSEARPVH